MGSLYKALATECNLEVKIKWDLENVAPPSGTGSYIVDVIKQAFKNRGYAGEIEITAFASVKRNVPSADDLEKQGVVIKYAEHERKNAADKIMREDIKAWKMSRPPPANLVVIAGDHYYLDYVKRLRKLTYNVIVVYPSEINTATGYFELRPNRSMIRLDKLIKLGMTSVPESNQVAPEKQENEASIGSVIHKPNQKPVRAKHNLYVPLPLRTNVQRKENEAGIGTKHVA